MTPPTRILVLTGCYLPGYKAGGPVRSISGMIQSLGDEFQFRVVTLDRDLGDRQPYPGVVRGAWIPVGKALVMYLPPKLARLDPLAQLIRETPHDVIYLGGGFDPTFVLRALLLRRLGLIRAPAVMLAPQGVFSRGALAIKPFKKRLFLDLAWRFGLYAGVTWHVSTIFEKRDVRRALRLRGKPHFVVVAPDIAPAPDARAGPERRKSLARLQVAFLSRICPMKNLDGALRILQGVDVPLDFHIYGPAEDRAYWRHRRGDAGRVSGPDRQHDRLSPAPRAARRLGPAPERRGRIPPGAAGVFRDVPPRVAFLVRGRTAFDRRGGRGRGDHRQVPDGLPGAGRPQRGGQGRIDKEPRTCSETRLC
jgi:glycosyltransferase involved in cell wall biosynthesis